MTAPVTGQGRTEPVSVDAVLTGEWIITLNADREIYRDGAIAALFDLEAKYAEVVDEDSVVSWLGQVHGKVS